MRADLSQGRSSLYEHITVPLRTDSGESITAIPNWLTQCRSNHPKCRRHVDEGSSMPTRLIYVGGGEEEDDPVKLIYTNRADRVGNMPYIALSHRWGNSATLERMKLTNGRIALYKKQLPLCDMSKYVQDAVWLTRELGLRYLWVDFLCIIQDSEDDWAAEAAAMCDVYERCTLCIAASFPAAVCDQDRVSLPEGHSAWFPPLSKPVSPLRNPSRKLFRRLLNHSRCSTPAPTIAPIQAFGTMR